jgi:hypothetical protein
MGQGRRGEGTGGEGRRHVTRAVGPQARPPLVESPGLSPPWPHPPARARLREEEARYPVDRGLAAPHPGADELEALQEVGDPAGQRLEGGVRLGGPSLGDLAGAVGAGERVACTHAKHAATRPSLPAATPTAPPPASGFLPPLHPLPPPHPTWLSYRLNATVSRSGLITTSPLSALTACCRLSRTTASRPLYLAGRAGAMGGGVETGAQPCWLRTQLGPTLSGITASAPRAAPHTPPPPDALLRQHGVHRLGVRRGVGRRHRVHVKRLRQLRARGHGAEGIVRRQRPPALHRRLRACCNPAGKVPAGGHCRRGCPPAPGCRRRCAGWPAPASPRRRRRRRRRPTSAAAAPAACPASRTTGPAGGGGSGGGRRTLRRKVWRSDCRHHRAAAHPSSSRPAPARR